MSTNFTYTDFPYCYDEEKFFVPYSASFGQYDEAQNAAIQANKEAIEKNTTDDKKALEGINNKLAEIEKDIENISIEGGITVSEEVTLFPEDNVPTSDDEKAELTISTNDNFNDVVRKLANAIKSLNNTVDGDIFKI